MLTSNMLIIQKIDLHTLAKYWHLIGNMHTNTKETYLVIGVQKRTLWVEKLLKDGLNYAKKLTLMIKRSSDVPQLDELAWSAASCQLPLLRFHFPSLFPLFFLQLSIMKMPCVNLLYSAFTFTCFYSILTFILFLRPRQRPRHIPGDIFHTNL